jgi:hypothetical protein
MAVDAQGLGNGIGSLAGSDALGEICFCSLAEIDGLPMCFPCALALTMPALVRSLIFWASTLANEASVASRMLRTSVAVKADTAGGEALQVHDGWHHGACGHGEMRGSATLAGRKRPRLNRSGSNRPPRWPTERVRQVFCLAG